MKKLNKRPSIDHVCYLSGDVETILNNRFSIESEMYADVAERFLDVWPHLIHGEVYEPAELVGYDYWTRLSNRERSACVLILKDFALAESPLISDWATGEGRKLSFFLNCL